LNDVRFEKSSSIQNSPFIVYGHRTDAPLQVYRRQKPMLFNKTRDIIEEPERESVNKNLSNHHNVELTGFVPEDMSEIYDEESTDDIDIILSNQMEGEYDNQTGNVSSSNTDLDLATDFSLLFNDTEVPGENNVAMEIEYSQEVNSLDSDIVYEGLGTVIYNAYNELLFHDSPDFQDDNRLSYPMHQQDEGIAPIRHSFVENIEENIEPRIVENTEFNIAENIESSSVENSESNVHMETTVPVDNNNDRSELVNSDVYDLIMDSLKTHNQATKLNKWDNKTTADLKFLLETDERACKNLSKKELLICIDVVNEHRQAAIKIVVSWNKSKLYCLLWQLLNVENIKTPRRKKTFNPQKLTQLTSRVINTLSKDVLSTLLCEDKWQMYYQNWTEQSPVKDDVLINGNHQLYKWFAHPSCNERREFRCHFTDCSHILTCLRTKICTTGIKGLKKDAWISAAKDGNTKLNIAIVVECIDKQSVAFAKRVFAEDVEQFMRNSGFIKEAEFVKLIRRWFEAEDDPGINAKDRCCRRLELKYYLLKDVNFGRFPPTTQYVKGIPIVTYEALLTHIDRKLQIYNLVPRRSYNVRSLGTQEVEQFFSTVRDLDPSGLGTPKPDDLQEMMATASMLDNARMNPDR